MLRQELGFWVGKIPWRSEWQSTPIFLPGESPGQSSLMGYNPQGCKGSHRVNLQQSRWRWSDHQWPISRQLSELTVLFSAWSPLPLSIKALAHQLSVGRVSLWTDSSTYSPWEPVSKIKQTFLSTSLAYLPAFETRVAEHPLWITVIQLSCVVITCCTCWV